MEIKKLIEQASFGDAFMTADGRKALFIKHISQKGIDGAKFLYENERSTIVFCEDGKSIFKCKEGDIVGRWEDKDLDSIKEEREKLQQIKAEIKKQLSLYTEEWPSGVAELKHLLTFIESLEKKQSQGLDEPEVDLRNESVSFCFDNGLNITPKQAENIARYFYELGKKHKVTMTKEEAKEILIDTLRSINSDSDITTSPEDFTEAMLLAIEEFSHQELQNLDEAAEKNSKEYYCSALKTQNETGICDGCENVKLAFKAGAKWQAQQGDIIETEPYFCSDEGECEVSTCTTFKPGNKVIVQIRKKGE